MVISKEDRYIIKSLFLATVVLLIIVTSIMVYSYNKNDETISSFMAVMIAGILGGFVSALRRKMVVDGSQNINFEEINHDKTYLIALSFAPPVLGVIFASILHLIFAAELLASPVFPTFACKNRGQRALRTSNEFH